jgi:PAS domain S-box-containing protein
VPGDSPRSFENLAAFLEVAPDAMVIVNRDGRIVLVNAQTERVFGYHRDELLNQPIEKLVPERYRGAHIGHRFRYSQAAHARPMGVGLELYGLRRDGSEFPVEISLSPLETEEGPLVASAIRDISDRRAAEAERARLLQERAAHVEANRIKDEFLATLSHELRTPLNAVIGWAGLLKSGALTAEAARAALQTIERNARMQAQLIEDLLDVSRILSGKLRLETCALDLAEVADAATATVRPAADSKRIALEIMVEMRPLLLVGDPDRLQQVLWNLLSNAIKFTPEGGQVELRVSHSDSAAHVVVRDTGPGIHPAFLPHVFDRFRQADSSTTRNHGGLGLGLAITRSIVELHGGTIEASSGGPGAGATFRVRLPAAAVVSARPEIGPGGSARLDGVRVLVVDDQPDERLLISAILHGAGAEIRPAHSVAEALAIVDDWTPAVIVSDIAMPDQDGYALIRRLRAHSSSLADTPAIAVTAHARLDDRERALAAGFQMYVAKPVRAEDLIRRVSRMASTSRRSRP